MRKVKSVQDGRYINANQPNLAIWTDSQGVFPSELALERFVAFPW